MLNCATIARTGDIWVRGYCLSAATFIILLALLRKIPTERKRERERPVSFPSSFGVVINNLPLESDACSERKQFLIFEQGNEEGRIFVASTTFLSLFARALPKNSNAKG